MGMAVSFDNIDRMIQPGIAIAMLRKLKGLSQEALSEKAGISRTLLSNIEAPDPAYSFSVDVPFSLADALEVDPADLINAAVFHDKLLKSKK